MVARVLDRVTVETFAPLVGQAFVLDDEAAGRLDLELMEAQTHDPGAPAKDASGMRAPFTLVFRGPTEPVLPQRIYPLEHEELGTLEIFIVPIGRDTAGTRYEAIFA
jgi:hypothetical protein